MAKIPYVRPYENSGTNYKRYKKWLGEVFYSNTCAFCFLSMTPNSPTIEHYYPKGKFPYKESDPKNLLLSCSGCNSIKSDFFDEQNPGIIFNCRKENLSKILDINKTTGELKPKKSLNDKKKERALFNIKKFKLNLPRQKKIEKIL